MSVNTLAADTGNNCMYPKVLSLYETVISICIYPKVSSLYETIVSNKALGLLYGHGILTIYENLLL